MMASENHFIEDLTKIILEHISDEKFGVEALAREAGMSRSNLFRKVQVNYGKNVSRFIRDVRLNKGLQLLLENEYTVAEVAYRVGFNTPSYFNKCFHEQYGFSPGEARKKKNELIIANQGSAFPGVSPRASSSKKRFLSDYIKRWNALHRSIKRMVLVSLAVIPVIVAILVMLPFARPDNSVIVLPFKNLSTELETENFADAIVDGIITQLSFIEDVSVRSRTTSDYFGAKHLNAKDIGQQAKAKYILEGSVQKTGDLVRITVQFIDAKKDAHLWSDNLDFQYTNILEIIGDIALTVADKLNASLSETESRQIRDYSAQNPEAWDNYLRGRFLVNKAYAEQRLDISPQGLKASIGYFERAIEIDSSLALAYAGLANAYLNLAGWGWLPDRQEGLRLARENTFRALELDPECVEALTVFASMHVWGGMQGDYEIAAETFEKALEINPDYPPALQYYAQLLMITGPIEKARKIMDRAIGLEPYFWVMHNLNAWIYYFERKHTEAINSCKQASELKPGWPFTEWLFFLNYVKLGQGEEALHHVHKIVEADPKAKQYAADITAYYNASGIEGLFKFLVQLNNRHPGVIQGINGQPFYNGWWCALLENEEQSIFYLKKALQKVNGSYTYFMQIAVNPDFDFMRNDPEFKEIIDQLGLTRYNTRETW